jgi:hypothetical protein
LIERGKRGRDKGEGRRIWELGEERWVEGEIESSEAISTNKKNNLPVSHSKT